MIRATTGGVLRGYRSNLMNSFITLNNARNTMLTQRNFNSYAEDPAAASNIISATTPTVNISRASALCNLSIR